VVGNQGTLAGGCVASSLEAEGVRTLGLWTNHHGGRLHLALVGEGLGIAPKRPIAQVPVFQSQAVVVLQAIARHLETHALGVAALVPNGTRVPVITITVVGGILAPAGLGTQVVGAGVLVVAFHRVADAGSRHAVVGHRARITIHALSLPQNFMVASVTAFAQVLGAVVAVVAEIDQVAIHLPGLVGAPVTVVIQAIAALRLGHLGITVGQPLLAADPLSGTDPPVIGERTGSPQGESHRLGRAGTYPGIGNTLSRGNAVHGGSLVARKSPRALDLIAAATSAEAALITEIDADIFRTDPALAVVAVFTGTTEVGM